MSIAGHRPQGYTVVETMIFLAVTGALFMSGVLLVSDQQRRSEFVQGVRDFDSRVQDVINDVSTGYYTRSGDYSCTAGAGGPNIGLTSGNDQGTNTGCIYIGRALQFGTGNTYRVHSIAGLRQTTSGKEVASLSEAFPTSIAPRTDATSIPDGTEIITIPGSLVVKRVYYLKDSKVDIGALAFFDSLSSYDTSGNLISGSRKAINVVPVLNTTLNSSVELTSSAIKNIPTNLVINPPGGITICLQSQGTSRYASLTIGDDNNSTATALSIDIEDCSV